MRIGMMVDTYKPYVSGITNYIHVNKSALEQAGHEVYVFTFGDEDYQDDEPRVFRSPGLALADTGYYLSLRYKSEHKKLLQTMDVVHVHHPFLSGRLALNYCRSTRIPVVFTNHSRYDLLAQAYLPLMPDEVSHSLLQAYLPDFCESVDLVVSPSAGMVKILRDLDVKSHIEVIPNGVDLRKFHNAIPFHVPGLAFRSRMFCWCMQAGLRLRRTSTFCCSPLPVSRNCSPISIWCLWAADKNSLRKSCRI
jgi:glycosyltransferase involved in cell wall biosynthesis